MATFVVFLNETIMSVALPSLMADLNISASAAQWLTSAFLLTMAVVIPTTGFIMQRLTTRAVFIVAMTSFCLGTLICAASPTFGFLLVGRIVQAVGTAIMMPLMMTTVMTVVPPESRGRTMGNISIVISVAPALGPTISGVILEVLSWRWMFWLVLPVGLAALTLGYKLMRNIGETRKAPLDLLSVVLSAIGFGGLVYGLSSIGEGAAHGGGSALPLWLSPAIGAIALVLFVLRQLRLQRENRALLDLRTLRHPAYAVALIVLAFSMLGLFGAVILLPILMQNVQGLTTLQSGLMLLPGGLVMAAMAPIVGRIYDRRGARVLVLPGSMLTTVALFTMSASGSSIALLLVAHLALSVGLALLFTPLFSSGLGALPKQLYSHGSALVSALQQVAGAAGIAVLISVMTLRSAALATGGADVADAILGGIQTAFTLAGALSILAIVGAFFVQGKSPGENH
ncbi:Permease, general substrate transporter [Ketogulonicigenium robustum]|uniref:Permease, general substrate transporter n=1 Tax=Ketogulonicigenium robustum TaxID=92947 RepID=A0A1W6P092_9RHOB|nr:Permease, general substrate transporter [Ketogulonicigenium robustum]